jgi:hypothetical protein
LEGERAAAHLRGLDIARSIRHPNLLAGFGAWIDDEQLILATELADGSLWDRFLAARAEGLPGIPRDELIDALAEAARGVDYLNEPRHGSGDRAGLGIQHRDLKPQNILLVGGGVKVADFGSARWMEEAVTGHTGLQWTPAYAAPEFFLGATSRHSDQYSLAVTYCHLRSGRLPFSGDHAAVMAGHLMSEPDLSMLDEVERPLVARALAKRPEARWPSCRAFVEALRATIDSAPGPAPSGTVARACLVWPQQAVSSLADTPPVVAYAGDGTSYDDADDSICDERPEIGTADAATTEGRLVAAPAPAPIEDALRADLDRRRQLVALASLVVTWGLTLGMSSHPRRSAPRGPARPPRPIAPAASRIPDAARPALPGGRGLPSPVDASAPGGRGRAMHPSGAGAEATPTGESAPPRPRPPGPTHPVEQRVEITRPTALRPVAPGSAEVPRPAALAPHRRLARLALALVANPTLPRDLEALAAAEAPPEPVAVSTPVAGRAPKAEIEPPAVAAEGPMEIEENRDLAGPASAGEGDATAQIRPPEEPDRVDTNAVPATSPTPSVPVQNEARGEPQPAQAAEAARHRGGQGLARGAYDAAIADYTEAIRLDPRSADAFAARAEALMRKRDFARAVADLDEALRLRPGSAPALNDRGLAVLGQGDVLRAIADLDAALKIDPGSAVIHYNRGIAYARLGKADVALAEYDTALQLNPGLAVARAARARVPARQVSLMRDVSRQSHPDARPVAPTPPPPAPSISGILPTPQDGRPVDVVPTPPAPAVAPPR